MDVYWEWHMPLSTLASFLGNFSGKKKKKDAMDS
jgi:hypothetical protein